MREADCSIAKGDNGATCIAAGNFRSIIVLCTVQDFQGWKMASKNLCTINCKVQNVGFLSFFGQILYRSY